MAHMYTALPDKKGERELATQLKSFPDNQLHLWFGIKVPGVRDIDIVIWHESAGVFVVEVKAVPFDFIESFGWQRCKIKGRNEDRGPQQQAHEALFSLRNFLGPQNCRPFITSVACFPQIRRSEWQWDDERVCGDYAQSVLFYEDFYSDPSALVERLHHIRSHPLMGQENQKDFKHSPELLDKMRYALDVNAKPKPSVSDLDKLKIIERRIGLEESKQVAPFTSARMLYTGRPGTGKTFRLLRVAHLHALEGAKVLFACFNKVLGADVKRILSISRKLALTEGELEVHDVFEMIKLYVPEERIFHEDPDEWARLVVEDMKEREASLPKFDTVLIDEAQDLKDWAFEMLRLHTKEDSTICVAAGTGQELYGNSSDSLKEFARTARTRGLRRSFRNTEAISKFSTVCYEADWDASQVPKAISMFSNKTQAQGVLEYERPGGSLPALVAFDESSLDSVDDEDYSTRQNELMHVEYARIIRTEIEHLEAALRPTDLLILVPSESSNQRKWAVEALESCGIPYLDYTHDSHRRFIAPVDKVRLCTFHSSRGIEGQRVIVFGLENLANVAKHANAEPRNLGYIVLSRAVLDMVIAYRPAVQTSTINFVYAVMAALRDKPGVAQMAIGASTSAVNGLRGDDVDGLDSSSMFDDVLKPSSLEGSRKVLATPQQQSPAATAYHCVSSEKAKNKRSSRKNQLRPSGRAGSNDVALQHIFSVGECVVHPHYGSGTVEVANPATLAEKYGQGVTVRFDNGITKEIGSVNLAGLKLVEIDTKGLLFTGESS